MYLIIILGFMIASWLVSNQLKTRFKKYAKIPVAYGMTGKDIAEKMLKDNGIHDVKVVSTRGQLTDHYNPATKTVNLSHEVYQGNSVSAAAVAAHECGHAVQHANAYSWLEFRTALVPLQNVSAKVMNFIFMTMLFGAFLLPSLINFDLALMVIIACYAIFTTFAFVTLPVEINASQRALAWLNHTSITDTSNHDKARDALKWAAYTYLVAALSSLAALLYWIFVFLGSRD
jgi:hypothetical protein